MCPLRPAPGLKAVSRSSANGQSEQSEQQANPEVDHLVGQENRGELAYRRGGPEVRGGWRADHLPIDAGAAGGGRGAQERELAGEHGAPATRESLPPSLPSA